MKSAEKMENNFENFNKNKTESIVDLSDQQKRYLHKNKLFDNDLTEAQYNTLMKIK
jgi:hypothetical protein